MRRIVACVVSVIEPMPGACLLWLEAGEIASAAKPGQFVMVRCGQDTVLRRPLSVHRVDGDRLALLFAVIGAGTGWLSRRQMGDAVDIFGPLGNGFTLPATLQDILLVAGGIGIAPLAFLAEEAGRQGNKVTLLVGTSSKTSLLSDDIMPFQTNIFITEDGSYGYKGLVTDWLESNHRFIQKPIFACGPLPMYKAMSQMPGLKNKPVQISLEARMGCGLGVCYSCTVKTKAGLKQVCQDGPVFDFHDILWDELNLSAGV